MISYVYISMVTDWESIAKSLQKRLNKSSVRIEFLERELVSLSRRYTKILYVNDLLLEDSDDSP